MQKLNRPTVVVICITVILSWLTTIFFVYNYSLQKTVYVDSSKLFENFQMTKEMKIIGEKEFNARKRSLDAIYSTLQSKTISEMDRKALMQNFIQGKEDLEQFNQNFAAEESSKIWARINNYAKEFSKVNKYQLVIASMNNNVLYADEEIDVTNALLIFINKKYEGIK